MADMADGDHLDALEKEYCPPLDPALLRALWLDYGGEEDGMQAFKGVLDGLRDAAEVEQRLGDFDPSGSGGSWASQMAETDGTGTDGTSTDLSGDSGSLGRHPRSASGSEESWSGGYYKDAEHLDTPTKETLLAETFPDLRFQLVVYTLKKCDNDLSRATDELLNHAYLEDSKSSPGEEAVPRGIDAFSEEFHVPRRGKRGKKRRKDGKKVSSSEADAYSAPPQNRWGDADRDVEFLVSNTKLSSKAISSLYHKNGAALAPTIVALIRKDQAEHEKEEPATSHIQSAIELTQDFSAIDLTDALSLIRLTDPSTANAHQLAKALTNHPFKTPPPPSSIIPHYTPLNLTSSQPPTPETPPLPSLPAPTTPHTTTSLAAARASAFTSATTAYRKGRSNPLMRAAASYYSQVGRDATAHLRAHTSAATDALIAQQSSPTLLDLHGASVADATRIARHRTRAWWDALGEQRVPGGGRTGASDGYRIVTGVGRHSLGGRGKLGPAVSRALIADGWRIEVAGGEVRVLGVARR